jgi:branched-chain amino acid transport system permease protein
LLMGVLQTLTVAVDTSFADLAQQLQALLNLNTEGVPVALTARLWQTPMSALAPLLPYVVLVVFLVLRPMGLMGRRAG